MPVISQTFSRSGFAAGVKLLFLGVVGAQTTHLAAEARSLNIEHVSPEDLVHQEICRHPPSGRQAGNPRVPTVRAGQALLEGVRRWFWARKPDAGFLLQGFPATLLHARVFDEWLEARGEALTACLRCGPSADPSVIEHYRTLGLLREVDPSDSTRLVAAMSR